MLVGPLQQDREFVPAEARHAVALPNVRAQQLRHMAQGRVTRMVAEAVVDHLQPVHVDEQHGPGVTIAGGPVDQLLELADKAPPVEQRHQRIVVRQLVKVFDALLQPRDGSTKTADLLDQQAGIRAVKRHVGHEGDPERVTKP